VAAVALAGAGVAVWYKLAHKSEDLPPDLVLKFKEKNLAVEPAPSPWFRDEPTRVQLESPYMLVYKRDNPEAFIAYGARDYDTREPRASELRAGLIDALGKLLEPNTLEPSSIPAGTTWLGTGVNGFRFRGRLKTGSVVEGEAYSVSHKGIAYWFLAWTGENTIYEEQKSVFAAARDRTKLLDLRKDWKVKVSTVVAYKGDTVGYELLDADGIWRDVTTPENLKDEGAGADRLFELKMGNRKNLQRVGNLIVYILPSSGDPVAQARQFVTEKRIAEVKAAGQEYKVTFKDRSEAPEGDTSGNAIDATSPVIRLQSVVEGASGQDRLHVISAAKIGEKTVIAHAWSDLTDRTTFEALFVQIAGSLRPN
jgi:hypothetical protein